MSLQSEAVKRWRANTKKRIIMSMGGKCANCSYERCDAALELHHLDPNEKDFSFGAMRANPKGWVKIVEELRKCVLLCAICHREVHAGILELGDNLPKFDESYAEYRETKKVELLATCRQCGKDVPSTNRTCSTVCAAKQKGSIAWDQIDLFEMLKSMSYNEIAEQLGCSSGAISKRVTKLRQTRG